MCEKSTTRRFFSRGSVRTSGMYSPMVNASASRFVALSSSLFVSRKSNAFTPSRTSRMASFVIVSSVLSVGGRPVLRWKSSVASLPILSFVSPSLKSAR